MQIQANFGLASRNIQGVTVMTTASANCADIVRHPHLVVTLAGLRHLEARLQLTPLPAPYPMEPEPFMDKETGEERLWHHGPKMRERRRQEKKKLIAQGKAEMWERRYQEVLSEWKQEQSQRAAQEAAAEQENNPAATETSS